MKLYEQMSLTAKHADEDKNKVITSNYFSKEFEEQKLSFQLNSANFIKIFKDFAKPYKNRFKVMGDIFSGIESLLPIALGLARIILSVFYVLAIFGAPCTKSPKKFALDALKSSAMTFITGIASLAIGVASFALWPFTLLRIFVRAIITHYTNDNKLHAENNHGYARLIKLHDESSSVMVQKRIAAAIIAKAYTDIELKNQTTCMNVDDRRYIRKQYIDLFGETTRFPQTVTNIDEKPVDNVKVISLFRELRVNNNDRIESTTPWSERDKKVNPPRSFSINKLG